MKSYHKEKKVSSSSLSWFQESPKYFKLRFDQIIEEEPKPYFKKGQEVHAYILEPEEFEKEYAFLDYEVPRSKQQKDFCEKIARLRKGTEEERLLKAYKEFYFTKEPDKKVLEKAEKLKETYQDYIKFVKLSPMYTKVLNIATLHMLNESRNRVIEHKKANQLLFNEEHLIFGDNDMYNSDLSTKNELEIYWEYPDNKLQCKSMLDRVIINHEKKEVTLVDLKTTSYLSEFKDKVKEYKYNRQLMFYWMALHWYFINELGLKLSDYTRQTYIIAISTKEPIQVKVFEISEPLLMEGFVEIENIMSDLDWHFENDKWEYSRGYYEGEGVEKI